MYLAHSILSLLLLLPSLPPAGGSAGVRDEGKFFSTDAIQAAERTIRQIQADEHRDVLIETVPDIPQDLREQFQEKGKAKFFEDWADSRAKERGISGVYILICRNPSHLQAAVGNVTEQKLFTITDRDELVRVLLKQFRQKQFDQGLLDAVDFIQRRMKAHAASPAPQSPSAEGSYPRSDVRSPSLGPPPIESASESTFLLHSDSKIVAGIGDLS